MKGKPVKYSSDELAWIKSQCELPRLQAHTSFIAMTGRADVTLIQFKSLCKRKGWFTGRSGRFEKGAAPSNKGKKMPFNANSAANQFKKGISPHNIKKSGAERIRKKDGYVEISIDEVNPHTGFERRYVLKHKHEWEKLHGPVPEGQCLKCLSDNRQNTAPENWQLVPRALLPRLNNRWGKDYDSAPHEVKPTLMGIAKLEHKLKEISK